ncbi:hypothetical protein B0H15DRAFT_582926 [Mycena belliarum]|uniref:Uncharacterized protein n=1 Tax=Mycena belliarum TaxID=1033014 RepID=A0AAD6UDN3_9AGAR|nr:hypothetical protein B0H15DRAFT_582926 [Mycena belliae]
MTATVMFVHSASRPASARPAVPPPTMTKSKVLPESWVGSVVDRFRGEEACAADAARRSGSSIVAIKCTPGYYTGETERAGTRTEQAGTQRIAGGKSLGRNEAPRYQMYPRTGSLARPGPATASESGMRLNSGCMMRDDLIRLYPGADIGAVVVEGQRVNGAS